MQQTIDSFLAWLVEEKGSTENTIAAYRNDLSQFLGFLSASRAVETWAGVSERQHPGLPRPNCELREYAPATVARRLSAVRSLFHYLVLTNALDDDPTVQVGVGSVQRSPSQQLASRAAQQLWDSVSGGSPWTCGTVR